MIREVAALALVLTLTACGGGSGGGTSSTQSPSAPTAPIVLQPGVVTATYAAGSTVAITLNATESSNIGSQLFVSVGDPAGVLQSIAELSNNSGGGLTITLHTSASKAVGQYNGNFSINVCSDSACAQPISGSPISAQYDIVVTAPQSGTNLTPLSTIAGVPDWETFQGNAGHTGYVPVTLDPSKFNQRWQWNAPAILSASHPGMTTVTVANGLIYLGSGTKLYSLKEADATTAWTYDFSGLQYPSVNPPAVSSGAVYMAAGQQESTYMWSFNAASGALNFKGQMSSQWENYLAPTVSNGVVFQDAGTYGGMYAFNTSSGAQQFFTGLQQFDQWTPAVDSNYAYAYIGGQTADTPAQLNVLDRNTGAIKASILDAGYQWDGYSMNCAPVLGTQGSVFAVNVGNSSSNSLIDFNIEAGNIFWSIAGGYTGNPAYFNGTIYAVNKSPLQFEARSEIGGGLLWSWVPPTSSENTFVSDVLLTTNLAFVSTNSYTYAIDLQTHAAVWSFPQTGKLAMSANGILYILTAPGTLTAINLN